MLFILLPAKACYSAQPATLKSDRPFMRAQERSGTVELKPPNGEHRKFAPINCEISSKQGTVGV